MGAFSALTLWRAPARRAPRAALDTTAHERPIAFARARVTGNVAGDA